MVTSDVPEFCSAPTLVLGCGNVFFGDDGFGCAVTERIAERFDLPSGVCVLDAGTGVRNLLFTICLSPIRPKRILIVDAFDAGRAAGEIFVIDSSELPAIKLDDFSIHQLPTSNLLRELEESCDVEVAVLACQTQCVPPEIAPGLSPAVSKAVQKAADWIMNEYLPRHDRRGEPWARSL